mgnify:FL=1
MNSAEEKLQQLGLTLPKPQNPAANYVPVVRTGNLLFLSGVGPIQGNGTKTSGKLGEDLDISEGYKAAQTVGINLLSRLKAELGDLDKVKRIVKLLAMVNATPDFTDHPAVANGCSDLMIKVFGERGHHARSAVGMSSLPFNIPVEIEMIVETEDSPITY